MTAVTSWARSRTTTAAGPGRMLPGAALRSATSGGAVASAGWPSWGTAVHLSVLDAAVLDRAARLVRRELAAIEKAASLRRGDAEIHRLYRAAGAPFTVSPLLAEVLAAALAAADRTDGDVDPTVANAVLALERAGARRRGTSAVPTCGALTLVPARPAAGWRSVSLDGRVLQVPAGVSLDLTAVSGAYAADRCAALVAGTFGTGALVAVGHDVASAGPAPAGGWSVAVEGRPDGAYRIHLPAGAALSTSMPATGPGAPARQGRRPVVDPRSGRPVSPAWRAVSVVADRAVEANALALATQVRGRAGLPRLAALGLPARLVTPAGSIVSTVSWPREDRAVAS